MMNEDRMKTEHAGEHLEGSVRQSIEERRKAENFRMFHEDSNGSPTRLHEQHGRDRNK